MEKIIFVFVFALQGFFVKAQNVGIGTSNPNPKAVLEVRSSNKGFLPPRLTEDSIIAMGNVPDGMLVYNTSKDCIMQYSKSNWRCLLTGSTDRFQPVADNYITFADSSLSSEIIDMVEGLNNTYFVTGTFSGTKLNLGNGIELLGNAALLDTKHAFVAKFDSAGKCIWGAKLLGGTNATKILPAGITVDDSNDPYITGTFNDSIFLFNANGNLFNKLSTAVSGDYDIFIIKLLTNGQIEWRRREGSNGGRDEGKALRVKSGELIVAGQFHGTQTFGTATQLTLVSNGGLDGFVVGYDAATGTNCTFTKRLGGIGDDVVNDVCLTLFGLYITGSFENSITLPIIGVFPAPVPSLGASDMFTAMYNPYNNPSANWVLFTRGSGYEAGTNLLVNQGRLFVAGVFGSNITSFRHDGPIPRVEPPDISSNGVTDGMLFCLESILGEYTSVSGGQNNSWIATFGGSGEDVVRSLDVKNSFCMVTGEFRNKLEFMNGYPLYSSGGTDGFAATFTTLTGDMIKATSVSSLYNDRCNTGIIKTNTEFTFAGNTTQPALFNGVSTAKPLSDKPQAFLWLMK
jgi:hypothetical protein